MSEILKGVAGQQTANYNAEVADNAATAAGYDTQAAIARTAMDARAAMGQAIAGEGATGLQLGTGSLLDVLTQSAKNASLDALTLRAKGANAANADTAEAGLQRATGRNALVQGIVGTGEKIAKAAAAGG